MLVACPLSFQVVFASMKVLAHSGKRDILATTHMSKDTILVLINASLR